jgi:hypothetical protein
MHVVGTPLSGLEQNVSLLQEVVLVHQYTQGRTSDAYIQCSPHVPGHVHFTLLL